MSIFEGEDETEVHLGRRSDLGTTPAESLHLDPLRHAIGALHDETGARVGTIITEVEAWWSKAGVVRRRDVDAREVVAVEVDFDPVQLGDDGYPVILPWVEDWLEADDPAVAELLAGRLFHGERELAVRWFDAAHAQQERRAWDTRFDVPADETPGAAS